MQYRNDEQYGSLTNDGYEMIDIYIYVDIIRGPFPNLIISIIFSRTHLSSGRDTKRRGKNIGKAVKKMI